MLYLGNCLEVLPQLEKESVDAVVTDSPYGISFMGAEWDMGVPGVPFWEEIKRVCKPGAHLVAFGGTRTFHRLVCAIEDAGWEIRDTLMWVYSGFPKSRNIDKALIKKGDFENAEIWKGWGTGLRPCYEPILLARKPLEKGLTVESNVLKWGTGALNIYATMIERDEELRRTVGGFASKSEKFHNSDKYKINTMENEKKPGGWTGNLLLDGSEEVINFFPEGKARFYYSPKVVKKDKYNLHPTVKPVELLKYLITLISKGVVLDPFMGSGSTGVACKELGLEFIGIELESEYFQIAKKRLFFDQGKV